MRQGAWRRKGAEERRRRSGIGFGGEGRGQTCTPMSSRRPRARSGGGISHVDRRDVAPPGRPESVASSHPAPLCLTWRPEPGLTTLSTPAQRQSSCSGQTLSPASSPSMTMISPSPSYRASIDSGRFVVALMNWYSEVDLGRRSTFTPLHGVQSPALLSIAFAPPTDMPEASPSQPPLPATQLASCTTSATTRGSPNSFTIGRLSSLPLRT